MESTGEERIVSESGIAKNTDMQLFAEVKGDYYSPSCHMTKDRKLGISVGGYVIVKSLREWHKACLPTDKEWKEKPKKQGRRRAGYMPTGGSGEEE